MTDARADFEATSRGHVLAAEPWWRGTARFSATTVEVWGSTRAEALENLFVLLRASDCLECAFKLERVAERAQP